MRISNLIKIRRSVEIGEFFHPQLLLNQLFNTKNLSHFKKEISPQKKDLSFHHSKRIRINQLHLYFTN